MKKEEEESRKEGSEEEGPAEEVAQEVVQEKGHQKVALPAAKPEQGSESSGEESEKASEFSRREREKASTRDLIQRILKEEPSCEEYRKRSVSQLRFQKYRLRLGLRILEGEVAAVAEHEPPRWSHRSG